MQRKNVAQFSLMRSPVGSAKLYVSSEQYNAHFKYSYIGYIIVIYSIFLYFSSTAQQWVRASLFTRFLDHT